MATFIQNNETQRKWRNNKLPNYYIPKAIKNVIIKSFEDKIQLQSMIKNINNLNINKSKPLWTSTLIFIIHQASSRDSLDVLNYYIKLSANKKLIVNSTFGSNNFTPIFRAAYLGSIKCLKLLVSCGADITSKNIKNENIYDAIKQGRYDIIKKDPEYTDFHNDRFDECLKWLNNYKEFLKKKKTEFKITNLSKLKKYKKKKIIKKKYEDPITEKDIINLYFCEKKTLNDMINYILNYNNRIELINNWFFITCDKGENDIDNLCRLVHNLLLKKIINKCDIDKIFTDELKETIKLDAPFCKKYINKLYSKHNFSIDI